jgi:hypothetical protein
MSKDLEVLIMRLKSGEYDGAHIMKACVSIEEMAEKIRKLEFMVENGLGYEDLQRDT